MFNSIYREHFRGMGIGRVARDQDFTANLSFYHNEYQIQYIFGGDRLFFNNGSCVRMGAGSIAIIDKNSIVRTNVIGGKYHDRLLIELEEGYFVSLCEMLGIDFAGFFASHHGVYHAKEAPEINDFIVKLDQTMRDNDNPNREQEIKLALLTLISRSSSWDFSRENSYDSINVRSSIEKQRHVYQVADYIAEHYTEIKQISELAERFYMSKAYLCRIFKEVTNYTITEYINLHRIAASKTYLIESDLSMQEIADKLGYESLTYFERVFKKQLAVTPLQFRKMHI